MRVIINGFMGGLGSAILRLATVNGVDIAAGIDKRVNIQMDAIKLIGLSGEPVGSLPMFNDIDDCDVPADVIIECSTAASVAGVMNYAVKKHLPVVLCTTGLTSEDNDKVQWAAESIPIFKSANMSVGVNIVKGLLKHISVLASELGFDIEIVEKHHNKKLDAPSGTALMLAEAINSATDDNYKYVYGRYGSGNKRWGNELGIHSIRGGTIFGEHNIIFAGHDEIIEIKHTALSKDVFAAGALKAADFLTSDPLPRKGLYGMDDLVVLQNL